MSAMVHDVEGVLESLPSEAVMRAAGFTDHRPGVWYLCRRTCLDWLTFNVDIDKETGEFETVVLDEGILQPHYYQRMGNAAEIRTSIDEIVKQLNDQGIHITHDHNRYGTTT